MPVQNNRPYIYLDLDRTLFNTERAAWAMKLAAHELYGLDAEQLVQEEPQFYVHVGDQYFYRFFDHLGSQGVEPAQAAQELGKVLEGQDFLYTDARELLKRLKLDGFDQTILSFGDPAYQGFKYRLVPELADTPFVCVSEPKGAYVGKHGKEKSVIIDDKHVADVPERCTAIQLLREQMEPVVKKTDRYIINDLRLARGLLT